MPERLVYRRCGEHELALHVHRPEAGGPRPGIVFFFGGGFVRGTPTQFLPQCAHLARRGMVAISAEYRVHERHGVDPWTCVGDARWALRHVRAHAAELGIDPARLAAGGGSAGGHLAAATTLLAGPDDPADDPALSCHADALVLFNPVLDNNPEDGYGAERLGERWRGFSPAHHVRPGLPPTLIQLGDRDPLIPAPVMLRFQHAMSAAGNRCDLLLYGGRAHGFFNPQEPPTPCFAQTLMAMDAFLVSLGWLDPL